MTPEMFTEITGYKLEFQKITCAPLAEYKIITKESFYQIFNRIQDCYDESGERFYVEIHDNDVLVYL